MVRHPRDNRNCSRKKRAEVSAQLCYMAQKGPPNEARCEVELMKIERLLSMFLRRGMRMVMNKGLNAGIDRMTRGQAGDEDPHAKARRTEANQMARKAKQGAKIARRMGRL